MGQLWDVGIALNRLNDSCITQLMAQGPSRTCNESKEEKKTCLDIRFNADGVVPYTYIVHLKLVSRWARLRADGPTSRLGSGRQSTLEATPGQIDDFFGQLQCKCYLEEVASVGD